MVKPSSSPGGRHLSVHRRCLAARSRRSTLLCGLTERHHHSKILVPRSTDGGAGVPAPLQAGRLPMHHLVQLRFVTHRTGVGALLSRCARTYHRLCAARFFGRVSRRHPFRRDRRRRRLGRASACVGVCRCRPGQLRARPERPPDGRGHQGARSRRVGERALGRARQGRRRARSRSDVCVGRGSGRGGFCSLRLDG